jgi:hypothetical protein
VRAIQSSLACWASAGLGRLRGRLVNFARLGAKTPRGEVLKPYEVAKALVAVGVENPAISGQVVIVDAAQGLLRP